MKIMLAPSFAVCAPPCWRIPTLPGRSAVRNASKPSRRAANLSIWIGAHLRRGVPSPLRVKHASLQRSALQRHRRRASTQSSKLASRRDEPNVGQQVREMLARPPHHWDTDDKIRELDELATSGAQHKPMARAEREAKFAGQQYLVNKEKRGRACHVRRRPPRRHSKSVDR